MLAIILHFLSCQLPHSYPDLGVAVILSLPVGVAVRVDIAGVHGEVEIQRECSHQGEARHL